MTPRKHLLTIMAKGDKYTAYCYVCKKPGPERDSIDEARADALKHAKRDEDSPQP